MKFLIISFFTGLVGAVIWLSGITLFIPSPFSIFILPIKVLEWISSRGWLRLLNEVSINQLALVSQFTFYFVVSYLVLIFKNRDNETNT